jgi:putative nucleotidyltransferase with HDIG domain
MSSELLTESMTAVCSRTSQSVSCEPQPQVKRLVDSLRRLYDVDFAVLDSASGELLSCPNELAGCNWGVWGILCRAVAERRRPEVIADEDPFYVLAIPVADSHDAGFVVICAFAAQPIVEQRWSMAMHMLGCDETHARDWCKQHEPLSARFALRLATRFLENNAAELRREQLERDVEDLSLNLSSTYEEISLLYRLTQNLKLSSNDEELGQLALEWLADVVPAESFALQLIPVAAIGSVDCGVRSNPVLLTYGQCPVTCDEFSRLVEHLGPLEMHKPRIVHGGLMGVNDVAGVRELLLVPLCEGTNLFGYLAAINHCEQREFGSVEASLLSSVAAILGIHSGNIELYRQQREFLRGVVRALTSAIDAKDPYTCGHSDRVARVAVRLAAEMGCDHETLNTIYLSGLLHDIGKIGIDDNVLRKPGKLTEVEYEHIKMHSEIGYRILKDLRQLDDVLPVVLHHHEQWDGKGYPHNLAADNIPLMARIVAVADAFDAMGSDRPYRQGMPEARLEQVLREGAGKQWDPEVVAAFFRARDQIRDIFRNSREPQREIPQWI